MLRRWVETTGLIRINDLLRKRYHSPTATIRFYFTDSHGANFGSGSFELGAHRQTAKFLDQPPFNSGSPVRGTFTFESSVPIAVIALRGFTNEAGEFLMTTLPVAPLSSASEETVYFPHFAAGGGWVTQVILVNPTDSTITETVEFLGNYPVDTTWKVVYYVLMKSGTPFLSTSLTASSRAFLMRFPNTCSANSESFWGGLFLGGLGFFLED